MQDVTRENALLLAAVQVGRVPLLPPSTSAPLDWRYLLHAAERQGVTPLLHDWLERHPELAVDPVWLRQLYDRRWAHHFRNRQLLAELLRVAGGAAEARIDLMALKGARLAVDYYRSPGLRPLSDLDLLVRPADVLKFGEVLRRLGYREIEPPPSYVDASRLDEQSREYCWLATRQGLDVLVEYRTTPMEVTVARLGDLDRTFAEPLRSHAADVWRRAGAAREPGSALIPMSPEDLLLQVATHLAAKHLDFRLIWLHDLARIVTVAQPFDWGYTARTAAALRLAGPVSAALEASVHWMGAPIASTDLDRVRGGVTNRSVFALDRVDYMRLRHLAMSLNQRDLTMPGPGIWPLGAVLGRLQGWRPRLRALRWVALPGQGYLVPHGTGSIGLLAQLGTWTRRVAHRLRRGTRW
jgi:hypothetical protein